MTPEHSNAPVDVAGWIEMLSQRSKLTKKSRAVIDALGANPRLASYGSVREVAEKSNVSIGTVSRTAQALGFTGWPSLQEQLRNVYITSLTAVELVDHRRDEFAKPAYVSLNRDRDNLNTFINSVDLDQITRIAKAISRSRRAFVIALGGYNGIGLTFAHSAWLHGYDVRVLTEQVQIVNVVSQLRIDDLVITISFWRLYEAVYETIRTCHENGVPVVMLAESVTHDIEKLCLECVIIPAEAVGFQPSMTSVVATVHAIVAELVALDPERSRKALELSESRWGQFQLFHTY